MPDSKFKLTQQQKQKLAEAERTLHDLLPEFDKFEECGGDCGIYRQAREDVFDRLQKLKQYYT